MKKLISVSLTFVLTFISVLCLPVYSKNSADPQFISVYLNGEWLAFEVPPFIENDRTLVPMRKIFEALGAEVNWEESTQIITAVKGDDTLILQIGSPILEKNSKKTVLDVPPKLLNGYTMVPLRAVSEGLNWEVQWLAETQTVLITSGKTEDEDQSKQVRLLLNPDEIDYLGHWYGDMPYFEQNDKIGFVNETTGELIPAIYEKATRFESGTAFVQQNGLWGIIDTTGKIITPFQYTDVQSADTDTVSVCKVIDGNLRWGQVDRRGNILVPIVYDSAIESKTGFNIITEGELCGLTDRNENEIIPLGNYQIETTHLGSISVFDNATRQYQIYRLNDNGSVICSDWYDNISCYSNGLTKVKKNEKYGFINNAAQLVIPPLYDDCAVFSDSLMAVKKDGKWGLVNQKGELVVDFQFDKVSECTNGYSEVCIENKYGVIDKNGSIVIPLEYENLYNDDYFEFLSSYGVLPVKKNGYWGLADTRGNLVADCTFHWIGEFNEGYAFFAEGNILGTSNRSTHWFNADSYGIISITGEIMARDIPLDPMYSYWHPGVDGGSFSGGADVNLPMQFSEGLTPVHDSEGKWGYINPLGEVVIPPQFETVTKLSEFKGAMPGADCFKNGYARVFINGAYNIIDRQGTLMLENGWYDISREWGCFSLIYSRNHFPNGKELFICENENGDFLILTNKCEPVLKGTDGMAYDTNGEFILRYDVGSIRQLGENTLQFTRDGRTGVLIIE